jgi:glycerol uptake facilitator-like aquaporin
LLPAAKCGLASLSSGAHYNPALTLCILIRGKITPPLALAYWAVQFVAAFIGGGLATILEPGLPNESIGYPAVADGVSTSAALVGEIIITFCLCHTFLHVATTGAQDGNSYYGLAIGFSVFSGLVSTGGTSGGAFNPAVAMLSVIAGEVGDVWIHIVGPLLGGFLAGLTFLVTHPSEYLPSTLPLGFRQIFSSRAMVDAVNIRELLAPYIFEFIGTFLLCFTIASPPGVLKPFAEGGTRI